MTGEDWQGTWQWPTTVTQVHCTSNTILCNSNTILCYFLGGQSQCSTESEEETLPWWWHCVGCKRYIISLNMRPIDGMAQWQPDIPELSTLRTLSTLSILSTLSGTQTLDMSPTKNAHGHQSTTMKENCMVTMYLTTHHQSPQKGDVMVSRIAALSLCKSCKKDSGNVAMVIDPLIQWVLWPYQQSILSFRVLLNVDLVNHSTGHLQDPIILLILNSLYYILGTACLPIPLTHLIHKCHCATSETTMRFFNRAGSWAPIRSGIYIIITRQPSGSQFSFLNFSLHTLRTTQQHSLADYHLQANR
jgi:hypothetical protein